MDFENNSGVEEMEVADPSVEEVEETGAEEQEPAEPVVEQPKTDADSAFAEMRRRAEEAEKQLQEYAQTEEARKEAKKRVLGDEGADPHLVAESSGADLEDVLEAIKAEEESIRKDKQIEGLEAKLSEMTAKSRMADDLRAIQKIDPSVQSLEDLGETFSDYVNKAGLSAEDAYYACKAKELKTKSTPPKAIGTVNTTPPEKEFFTEAEVDKMTEAEQRLNADKILASMSKW